MAFIGLKVLRQIASQGSCRISSSHKLTSILAASSSRFSTSSKCIKESSPEEFVLKHQKTSEKSSNTNWLSYRVASIGLLGSLAACAFFPGNMIVDFTAVTLLVHHNHFGVKSVIADYVPLFFKGSVVNMFMYAWLFVSIITLALLYNFNYSGIGFSKALVKFFNL